METDTTFRFIQPCGHARKISGLLLGDNGEEHKPDD
jgi:hypothetical protein